MQSTANKTAASTTAELEPLVRQQTQQLQPPTTMPGASTAPNIAIGRHSSAATTTTSSLSQDTAARRAARRQLFLTRTRQLWNNHINPNLRLCLCATATQQLEAEAVLQNTDRTWVRSTPEGMAAAAYAETAADSIGGAGGLDAEEVEIYRRFLFDDDEATYSKCEDDDEDCDDAEGGADNGEGGAEAGQGRDGRRAFGDDEPDGNATGGELGQQPPDS